MSMQNPLARAFSWFPLYSASDETTITEVIDTPSTAIEDFWSYIRQSVGLPGSSPYFRDFWELSDDAMTNYVIVEAEDTGATDLLRDLPPDPSEGVPDSILPFVQSRWALGDEYMSGILTTDTDVFDTPKGILQNSQIWSFWEGTWFDTFLFSIGTTFNTIIYWFRAWVDCFISFFIVPIQTNPNFSHTSIISQSFAGTPEVFTHIHEWGDPFFSWYAQPLSDDFLGNWVGLSPFLNGFFSSFHIFGFLTVGTLLSLSRFFTNGRYAWYVSNAAQVAAHYVLLCLTIFPIPQTEIIFEKLTPIITFPIGLIFLLQSMWHYEETYHTVSVDEDGRTPMATARLKLLPRELEWKWSWDGIYSFRYIFLYTFIVTLTIPMTLGVQGFTLLPQPALTLMNVTGLNFVKYTVGLVFGAAILSFLACWFCDAVVTYFNRWLYIQQRWDPTLPFSGNLREIVPELTATRTLRLLFFTLALAVSFNTVAFYANEQTRSEGLGFSSPNENVMLRTFWLRDIVPPTSPDDTSVEDGETDWLDMYYEFDDDLYMHTYLRPLVTPYFDQWRDSVFERHFLEDNFEKYDENFLQRDRASWRDEDNLEAEKEWENKINEMYLYKSDEVIAATYADRAARTSRGLRARAQDDASMVDRSDEEDDLRGAMTEETGLAIGDESAGGPRGFMLYLLQNQKRRFLQRRQTPRTTRFAIAPNYRKDKTLPFVDRPNVGGSWLLDNEQIRTFDATSPIAVAEGLNFAQRKPTPAARTNLLARLDERGRPLKNSKTAGRFNSDGSFRLFTDFEDSLDDSYKYELEDDTCILPPPILVGNELPRRCALNSNIVRREARSTWLKTKTKQASNALEKFDKIRDTKLQRDRKRQKALSETSVTTLDDGGLQVKMRSEPVETSSDSVLSKWFSVTENQKPKSSNSIEYKRLEATETKRLLNPLYFVQNRLDDYDHTQDMTVRRDYIDSNTIKYEMKDGPVRLEHSGFDPTVFERLKWVNPIFWAQKALQIEFYLAKAILVKPAVKVFDIVTLNSRHRIKPKPTTVPETPIQTQTPEELQAQQERADRVILKQTRAVQNKMNRDSQGVYEDYFNIDAVESSLFNRFDYERTMCELVSPHNSFRFNFYESYYRFPTTQLTIRLLADRLIRNSLVDPTATTNDISNQLTNSAAQALALEHAHEKVIEYHNSMREYSASAYSSTLGFVSSAQTKSKFNTPYRQQFKGRRNTARRLTFTNRDEVENMLNSDIMEYVKPVNSLPSNIHLGENQTMVTGFGPSLHENVPYGFTSGSTDTKKESYTPWQTLWRKALVPTEVDFMPLYVSRDPETGKLVLVPTINRNDLSYTSVPKQLLSKANTRFIAEYFDPKNLNVESIRESRDFLLALPAESIDRMLFMSLLPDSDPEKKAFLKFLKTAPESLSNNYSRLEALIDNDPTFDRANIVARY